MSKKEKRKKKIGVFDSGKTEVAFGVRVEGKTLNGPLSS